MKTILFQVLCLSCLISCTSNDKNDETLAGRPRTVIHELNANELPDGNTIIALVGGQLIDGNGGEPVLNSCIIVRNNKIEFAGKQGDVSIPSGAEVIDVNGMTILPGLFDAHYHNENSRDMPSIYLRRGITSVRDPGEWIEMYDSVRLAGLPIPRLFLTGPHLNTFPPAYPEDAIIVQDSEEGRLAVERLADDGATAIKVYFGLPLGTIKEVCTTAHKYGLPVTAHLEITNAWDAINAGLDGIEHVTSFGPILIPPMEAEQYKLLVLADNDARKRGRYEVWNRIYVKNNEVVDSLCRFLADKKIFLSPTLAAFEKRSDKGDSVEVNAFRNMLSFIGLAKKAGVRMVVGSHTYVAYAENGYAYFREMELLHEAGLTPMEVLVAATMENARYFRVDERLGSIEKGKLADIIIVEGDPLKDIKVMRNVRRVMMNGVWVP
ncbi:MAG TPA: amidohydrolase family protein [Chryseolinea sp.]|nr:amidohydrolase family protein [Chryseolinea sp.]